jgi:restriction system protein
MKFIASRSEFKGTAIPDRELRKMFDGAMYKIALRTIYELFEVDMANALAAISFNGWVITNNKATGKKESNCILSIQVTKEQLREIDLQNVDPKACFKALKGVASSELSSITPVRPILEINKADKRFVESYGVADSVDDSTNIAAMDWEDFEHLIRELFEKEFSVNGGEVK